MEAGPINEAVKPISWLLGTWLSENGKGIYPTIKSFEYFEEITFENFGQPLLTYTAKSWNAETKKPMHFESGFLRIKPDTTTVAFMIAHNAGVVSLEEGEVDQYVINLKSSSIGRMAFGREPAVKLIERCFKLTEIGSLMQILKIETTNTSLQEHTKAEYKKVTES